MAIDVRPRQQTIQISTALGRMLALFDGDDLLWLQFADSPRLADQLRSIQQRTQGLQQRPNLKIINQLQRQLDAYFNARLRHFEVSTRLLGSEFQRQVWTQVSNIGYGARLSYQAVGERLGRPNAARAVGQANACNPIAILIPCHRLVSNRGDLRGYAGGTARKQALLDLEASHSMAKP